MFKKIKYTLVCCLMMAGATQAQVTQQSPYSKYGLGNIKGSLLPHLRAMGGISTGVYRGDYFNSINIQNPSSYAGIGSTVLDIGLAGSYTQLENATTTENSFNASISHVAMAFPITKNSGGISTSALSIGILPYSDLGYNFKNTSQIGSGADAKTVNNIYQGEGGLTKAYIGYGFQLGDHFRLGANAEYLFGNMIQSGATEIQGEQGASINTKIQNKNNVGGFSFSYGAQYDFRLDSKTLLVLGYSGSLNSKINSTSSQYTTLYYNDEQGNERPAIDTLDKAENPKASLKLPLLHNFGFSIQRYNNWMFGVDYRLGKWSNLSINNVNQDLQDTYGFSVGGQYMPDAGAISGYFKKVDYRLGFSYDKTYIQLNNQDIKQMSVTVGMGLPLYSLSRNAFYRMNVAAELGKRGKVENGLLQERYVNFSLGFTLNDKWFQRFRFD